MAEKYSPSILVDVVHKGLTPPNCDVTLQISATYAEGGVAKGIWKVGDPFINGIGVAMGGFVASAADIMMAYAISSVLTEDQTFASIDLHTTFHKPVFVGEVEVEAKVERVGRKLAYVKAELFQNSKKVADVVSSIMIMNKE